MKPAPTPEMIDAFIIAKESADRRLYGFHNLGRHFILDGTTEVWFTASDDYEVGHAAMMAQLERLRMEAALSAALSQPAAAVVGDPVGYVSAPELVQLKMGASCVDLFREPQPGGIDFAPIYAAPSATERDAVVEPVAYASSKEWRKNHLMSAAQYKSALPKNVVDFDIPLYATLPNEALERSEQATFDIAARLLKERDALADRISQQDAELERVRRELAEAKEFRAILEGHLSAAIDDYNEARKAAFIEAAEIAYAYECSLADYDGSVDAKHFYEGGVGDASIGISKALRAKAEETDRG